MTSLKTLDEVGTPNSSNVKSIEYRVFEGMEMEDEGQLIVNYKSGIPYKWDSFKKKDWDAARTVAANGGSIGKHINGVIVPKYGKGVKA